MPSPDRPAPPAGDPADPPVHHIAFPMGTEGPYSLAEIRGMLSAGRVHPEDRVMQEGGTGRLVAELVPDAAELAAKAERVRRRSTSGPFPVQGAPANQPRRFRTPLPVAAPEAPRAEPPAPPRRRLPHLLAILAILAVGLAALLLRGEAGLGGPPPVLPPVGMWRVAELGKAGGPWTFSLDETVLTVTAPDGGAVHCPVERRVVDDRHVQLTLAPPHPALGAEVALALADAEAVEVTTAKGAGRGVPVR